MYEPSADAAAVDRALRPLLAGRALLGRRVDGRVDQAVASPTIRAPPMTLIQGSSELDDVRWRSGSAGRSSGRVPSLTNVGEPFHLRGRAAQLERTARRACAGRMSAKRCVPFAK
jgi:hypothetical protein